MKSIPCRPKLFFLCAVFLGILTNGIAQNTVSGINDTLKLQRLKSIVELDGLSNEAAWEEIIPLPVKMRIPESGNVPSEKTEILMGYDDNYLYVAGRFYDKEVSKIQAASFKRDVWTYTADHLAVIIDGFNDNENGALFLSTPAGTRTDVNILNDGDGAPSRNINTSWNTFWDAESVITDEGWFTEIRIPFSSLRFETKNNKTVMGILGTRWIARKFEQISFPLIPEELGWWGGFKPSQLQTVVFEGISRRKPLYVTPYVLGGFARVHKLNEMENEYSHSNTFARELGLDVKYGITNNLTLDVTLNPDFAQVEADDQVINLTRYSLFFPEKRLFFQERSGNFDFRFENSDRLFYSRKIGIVDGQQVRIYGGARIVGRVGRWDIGLLNMQTEEFNDFLSENMNVLRVRKQVINPYSYIGAMITSRIGNKNNWNSAYGLDGIFRLFGDDYLTIKWAQSFQHDNSNELISLDPSRIYVNWNKRNEKGLGYNMSYSRSGDQFNPSIGYVQRDNFTRFGDRIQYGWFPDSESKLQIITLFADGFIFIGNEDGETESSAISPGLAIETKNGSSGTISFTRNWENIDHSFSFTENAEVPVGTYSFYSLNIDYSSARGKLYRFSTSANAGSFYDGTRFTLNISPSADFSKYIQLQTTYEYNTVKFPDRNQQFTGHIGRIRISSFLNSKFSLVSLLQYNSLNDFVIANIRFRFNPSEGHDLYIVYDEGINTQRKSGFPKLPLSNNRTILIKYNYTFKIGV